MLLKLSMMPVIIWFYISVLLFQSSCLQLRDCPGPLHAPQVGSGGHGAGSITSVKTHHEVHHAGILGTASMDDGALF